MIKVTPKSIVFATRCGVVATIIGRFYLPHGGLEIFVELRVF